MKKQQYDNNIWFEKIIVVISLIGSMILAFLGMLLPPIGVIDNSILILEGEVLLFIGSVMGIRITALKSLEQAVSKLENEQNNH